MALILHIDSSLEEASICLSDNGKSLFISKNTGKHDHAAWLHTAIKIGMEQTGEQLTDTDAISVTIGPGSYTGLRIGLASAKGICYILKKPLIGLNTLKVMASAVSSSAEEWICPMIDARRMEVFTAVYNKDLAEIKSPAARILDANSFRDELKEHEILFCGNGTDKFKNFVSNDRARFTARGFDALDMISLAEKKFDEKDFLDLAYAEPLYLKEFHTPGNL